MRILTCAIWSWIFLVTIIAALLAGSFVLWGITPMWERAAAIEGYLLLFSFVMGVILCVASEA